MVEEMVYLEPDQIWAIIAEVMRISNYPERDGLFLEVLYVTGGRISEICQLKVKNIGIDSIMKLNLKQRKQVVVGTGAQRHKESVPKIEYHTQILGKILCDRIHRFCKARKKTEDDYIFDPNPTGRTAFISRKYFNEKLKVASEKLNIKVKGKQNPRSLGTFTGAYPHIFRHSCAMFLLENVNNAAIVQAFLGHSNPQSTQRYAWAKNANVAKAIKDLDWGRPPGWNQLATKASKEERK